MNLRPHGPEPCALPDCATPRRHAAGRLSARRYECYFTLFFIRCQMFVGGEPHFMRFSVSCPHVFHTFPRRAFSALRVRCGYILQRRKLFSNILARCGKRLLILKCTPKVRQRNNYTAFFIPQKFFKRDHICSLLPPLMRAAGKPSFSSKPNAAETVSSMS